MEQLRKRAKEFRDRVRTGNPKFTKAVRELHPRLADGPVDWARFSLADAQLVVAHEGLRQLAPAARARQGAQAVQPVASAPGRRRHRRVPAPGLPELPPSWEVRPGEVADDERRHARARELLAAQP